MLLNPERDVYQAYGLKRSYLRSWSLKTVRRYIQLIRSGHRWRGIEDDSAQLGGDFIIDEAGILRFVYRSRDPTDRPSVEMLLAKLVKLHRIHTGQQKSMEHSDSHVWIG